MSQANFLRRNQVAIRMDGQDYRHDEGLTPFHALIGWDQRCGACRQVQAYLKRLDMTITREGGQENE